MGPVMAIEEMFLLYWKVIAEFQTLTVFMLKSSTGIKE